MACRSELESDEAWSHYLHQATEQEAYEALGDVLTLACKFESQHKPTSAARMRKMFDAGEAIYAQRFGREWVPF